MTGINEAAGSFHQESPDSLYISSIVQGREKNRATEYCSCSGFSFTRLSTRSSLELIGSRSFGAGFFSGHDASIFGSHSFFNKEIMSREI